MSPSTRLKATAFATTAIGVSGVSLLAPVLPELALAYGVTNEAMAWFQTAVMLPGVLSGVLAMKLAEHVSLRRVLVGALVLYAISGASLVWVDQFGLVLALRLAQGLGSGVLVGAAFAVLRRLDSAERSRAVGRNAALVSAMMVIQPLLGSWLAGIWLKLPFGVYALASGVALLAWRWAPNEGPADRGARTPLPTSHRVPVLAILASTVLLNTIFFGWLLYLTPIVLEGSFGVSVETRGLVLASQSLGATLLTLATNPLRSRGWHRRLVAGGWVVAAATFSLLAFAESAVVAVAIFAVAGLFFGVTHPSMINLVTDLGRDSLVGWWQSCARAGQVAGPLLAAAALRSLSGTAVLLSGAALTSLGLLLVAKLRIRPAERSGEPGPAPSSSRQGPTIA